MTKSPYLGGNVHRMRPGPPVWKKFHHCTHVMEIVGGVYVCQHCPIDSAAEMASQENLGFPDTQMTAIRGG